MESLSTRSKTELASSLTRAKALASRARESAKAITKRTVSSALTVGAGAAVGVLHAEFGEGGKVLLPGTEVEADLVLGIVTAGLGVAGVAGEYSDELAAIGSGALAGYAAIKLSQK